jgi:adenosylcobinamide-phosphate synthase
MQEQVIIVIAAVVLDWLLGDPRQLPHPVAGIGKLISLLELALRRRLGAEGRLGGVFLVLLTVAGAVAAGWGIISSLHHIHPWVGLAGETMLAWFCLAARSLHQESWRVAAALEAGNLDGAREALSHIVGRDTAELSEEQVWRATVETVAENSSDGVVAPLFYLMLGGPLAALAYKAINTLDSMVGYKNERYLHFGWAAARLDDLLNWIPARLTGLLICCAAPVVGLSGGDAWRIMGRDGRNHSSPNAGIPEAAAAGALGVQLGGTSSYSGQPVTKPTIGEPLRTLEVSAWRGSIRLMYGAELLLVGFWLILFSVLQQRIL